MRKFFKKRSTQILSVLLLLPLLVQSFVIPIFALDEILPETQVDIPIDTSEDILDEGISDPKEIAEPTLEKDIPVPKEIVKPTWVTSKESATTSSSVVLGEKYVYPNNSDVTVTFSKLPTSSSTLTISTVYLTDEQVKVTNAASNVAYDITTDMVDGTFNYDLTLPKVGDSTKVVYAESVSDLVDAKDISNVVENGSSLKIEGLDHFTTFVVVSTIPSGITEGTTEVNSNCTAVSIGSGTKCYDTIQEAVAASVSGDVINIMSGTYTLSTTLTINTAITIQGQGNSTIIDATATGLGWGIHVNTSNVTLKNFKILAPQTTSNRGGYSIHASSSQTPMVILSNITLDGITVENAQRTPFDFNGVNDVVTKNLVAKNSTYGNGLQLSGVVGATVENITTSGNVWGGIAIYVSKPINGNRGSQSINISNCTLEENNKLYVQDEAGLTSTNISATGFNWTIKNPTSSSGYTFYQKDVASAVAYAKTLPNPSDSYIRSLIDSSFYVAPGMSIQTAINAATSGDTINVATGTYNENIAISKSISLLGENKGTTIINGGGTGVVVTITAKNVTLKNFTIKGSGSDLNTSAGIGLAYVTGVTIENNIITNNVIGIAVMSSSSNNINNNEIKNSARYGIVLEEYPYTQGVFSTSNTISGNTLTSNARDGIYVGEKCNGNTITNNSISGAMGTTEITGFEANGIYFWRSSSNIVTGNTIFNNINYGIEMHGSSSNTITGNTIRNNQDGFHIKNIVETTGYSIKDNNISNNKIYDNTRVNLYADPNFIFTIEKNWWGSPDKATIISKLASWDASGDFVIPGTTVNLDFDPWCATSDCNIFSNTVLPAPTNLTPPNNTFTNDFSFNNTWTAVAGAVGYEYQTSYSSNGSSLGTIIYHDSSATLPNRYNLTGSTIVRTNLNTPDATYYWQVRAISADGTPGAWSVINKVVVDTTAPNTPVHTSPDDDKYINYNDFWFDWSDVSDAVSYEIQNSTNPSTNSVGSFTTVMWTGDYQHIQPTISKSRSVGASGTWYWQVRAIDATGNKSAWSTPWKITIDTTAPVGGQLTMATKLFPLGITIASPNSNGVYLLPDLSMDGVDVFQSLKVVVTDTNLDTTNVPVYVDGTPNGYMIFDSNTNIWNYGEQSNVPNFPFGTHNLVATFKDRAGNTKQLTARFTTDNTAPLITVNNFITSDNTPQIMGTIDDNTASISVKIGSNTFSATNNNNGTWILADNTITPALADGTYDVIATATDTAGNSSTDTTTGELTIDATTPQINNLKYYKNGNLITTPSTTPIFVKSIDELTYGADYQDNMGLNRTAFVIWDATDTWNPVSNSHKCNWNGSPSTTTLNSSTSQTLSEVPLKKCNPSYSWPSGKYIISHVVYDNVGNYSYNTGGSQRFIIDNIAPSVSFTGQTPESGSYVKGNITGHVTATDNVGMGSYYIRVWKNAFESGSENLVKECHSAPGGNLLGTSQDIDCSFDTATVSDGKYVFSAQFLDSSSNWGTAFRTFYVDNTIPRVTIKIGEGINDGSLGSNNVYSRISFKLNDPNGGLASVVLNGHTYPRTGAWNDLNWTNITKSHLIEGLNTIYAIDRAGNQSMPLEFTIDRVDPVGDIQGIRYPSKDVQNFITNDNTPIIYGTCSDNKGVSKVEVAIDNNVRTLTCDNNGNWVSSEFSTLDDGVHNITLTITDLSGNISTVSQILTIDTKAPKATYTYYRNGTPITDSIAYVKGVDELSFTAVYSDDDPSSGILKDTYVIFNSNEAGTARTSVAYCKWRDPANTLIILNNPNLFDDTVPFTNCEASLADGAYFMYHQVYDNSTRKDIPSITQYRDVKGLHFVVDSKAPVITISDYSTDWTNQDIDVTASTNEGNLNANSHTFTENGSFVFEAKDSAGNTTTETVNITKIDKTSPTINSMVILNGLLTVTSTDTPSDVKSVEVQINGGTWTPYTPGMNLYALVSNVPGTYPVSVRVTDNANNPTTESTSFTIPQPATTPGGQTLGARTQRTVLATTSTLTEETTETTTEEEITEEEILGETTCEATYKISGTVYYDNNDNGIKDDNEKVVEGIKVNIYNSNKELEKTVTTDEKGYWEASLCPGEYTTQVEGTEDQTFVLGDSDTTLDISVEKKTNWWLIAVIGSAVVILLVVLADRYNKRKVS